MMGKKDFQEALPWDFIDSGISKGKNSGKNIREGALGMTINLYQH